MKTIRRFGLFAGILILLVVPAALLREQYTSKKVISVETISAQNSNMIQWRLRERDALSALSREAHMKGSTVYVVSPIRWADSSNKYFQIGCKHRETYSLYSSPLAWSQIVSKLEIPLSDLKVEDFKTDSVFGWKCTDFKVYLRILGNPKFIEPPLGETNVPFHIYEMTKTGMIVGSRLPAPFSPTIVEVFLDENGPSDTPR